MVCAPFDAEEKRMSLAIAEPLEHVELEPGRVYPAQEPAFRSPGEDRGPKAAPHSGVRPTHGPVSAGPAQRAAALPLSPTPRQALRRNVQPDWTPRAV